MRVAATLVFAIVAANAAAAQTPEPEADAATDEELIVVGERPPGAIPGNPTPELSLDAAQVQSYGASNIVELLSALTPQLNTARGRGAGAPVVLLNGRRVASFAEIRAIPSEAIQRVQVFSEETALEFGFAADQRVINIILRPRYRALTTEGDLTQAADGARFGGEGEVSYLRLTRESRFSFEGALARAEGLTQEDRGVFLSPGAPIDDRAFRTLAPETGSGQVSAVANRAFSSLYAGTASFSGLASESEALVGHDAATGGAIRALTDVASGRINLTLDRSGQEWIGALSLAAGLQETAATVAAPSRPAARSVSAAETTEAIGTLSGSLAALPAGKARLALRAGLSAETLTAEQTAAPAREIDRTLAAARATLTLPLTSRRREVVGTLGDVTANLTAAVDDVSDVATLTSFGGGLAWSPVGTLRLSAQFASAEAPPTLEDLGAAAVLTPGVQVLDPLTGESRAVAVITGGDPTLQPERREDLTLNASWSPDALKGLTFTASYVDNRTEQGLSPFPVVTPELEAAFPARFVRAANGDLIQLDRRSINFALRETKRVQVGTFFSRGFGPQVQPPWGSGPPPWTQGGQQTWRPPPGFFPPPGGFGAGGGGGRGGGFQGRTPPQVGQASLSLSYTERLSDDLALAPGQPAVSLLDSALLGAEAGGAGKLDLEAGLSWRGLGLRLSAAWAGGYDIPGASPASAVSVSDAATINLRAFISFDRRPDLVRAYPLLRGVRLAARIDNLTDTAPEARNALGETPFEYQEALLTPLGRSWTASLRKQF